MRVSDNPLATIRLPQSTESTVTMRPSIAPHRSVCRPVDDDNSASKARAARRQPQSAEPTEVAGQQYQHVRFGVQAAACRRKCRAEGTGSDLRAPSAVAFRLRGCILAHDTTWRRLSSLTVGPARMSTSSGGDHARPYSYSHSFDSVLLCGRLSLTRRSLRLAQKSTILLLHACRLRSTPLHRHFLTVSRPLPPASPRVTDV
jgi:hypothetical protein